MAVSSIFNQGVSALNNASAWITVTGNNVANAETEGYSRQYVVQSEAVALTSRPGERGQGVNTQYVMRYYDDFLESSYVRQLSTSSRWAEQETAMASVENLFNESNRTGISSLMTQFFASWNDLTLRPNDTSTRQSLVSYSDNLADMIRTTRDNIRDIQYSMNLSISEAVDRVNEISKAIVDINRQINQSEVDGINIPNSMYDKRDSLVREMAELIDITTIDNGKGNFSVLIENGRPLVDGYVSYDIALNGPTKQTQLVPPSTYKGDIIVQGEDAFEYTFQIVKGGDAGAATFRVSLDGGVTWLMDENGSQLEYRIEDSDGDGVTDPLVVKNLTINFTDAKNFYPGDSFNVVPKDGLYWIEPTRGPENITPQISQNGTENTNRVTGGKLAAYYNVRDDNCGRYLDELNAVSESLIWEVNRLHSQGSGLSLLNYAQGTYTVSDASKPLGTARSGLYFADRLEQGNVVFDTYNSATGKLSGRYTLDFDDTADGIQNFDPQKHSLQDLANAINKSCKGEITASIQDNRLVLGSGTNNTFTVNADTSGVLAALGINTYFEGTSADDIAVSSVIRNDTNYLCAALSTDGEVNPGDADTAVAISALARRSVKISTTWKTVLNQSLSQYYNSLVGTVGSDTRTAHSSSGYSDALAKDLLTRVESVSGVNLDEEMSNLIKYQSAYTAAAKLITTADEMLQTVLGLKS